MDCFSLIGALTVSGDHALLRPVTPDAFEVLTMDAISFRVAVMRRSMLQLVLNGMQAFTIHRSQLMLCHTWHGTEPRVAHWLLLAQDWLEADQDPNTHRMIRENLGIRRAGVTDTLNCLAHAGVIHTAYTCITVSDCGRL